MNDTISDLLVRVANAKAINKSSFTVPFSKIKEGILSVLKEEGYVGSFSADAQKKMINVDLTTSSKQFKKIRRISRPGRRSYIKSKNLTRPKGYGIVILSTPQGVVSGKTAKQQGLGGELICEVF
jgi:small subunit ribosomal protein S8